MPVKVTIRPNGPYLVEGEIDLVPVDVYQLDLTKPFCDGTHSKVGFQAAEAAVAQEKK